MSNLVYNWQRFWCPRGHEFKTESGGYLVDPESWWGKHVNSHVVPFYTISNKQCLILLGGPGVGKSTALRRERETLAQMSQNEPARVVDLDLRSVGSEATLRRWIFENPTFLDWASGQYHLHLFLDSLDEGLLHTQTLTDFLIGEFKQGNYPIERLFIRIACRTAVWPFSFEQGVRKLWEKIDKEAVGVYTLAPLRRRDILEAAIKNQLGEAFIGDIEQVGVVPLAVKPITLKFLLKTYRKGFPKTQLELYEEGCLELCRELGETRQEKGLVGAFSAEQCLAVASRIASLTMFCGKAAVYTLPSPLDKPDEDLTVELLAGGTETVKENEFVVSETAIRETLSKDLFGDRGQARRGWDHQTEAEFLAARFLVNRRMEVAQIMSLIKHPEDPEGKLVPQLHEAAAWLARLSPAIFQEILRVEPDVLLRSDVEILDEKDREALTLAVLQLFDEEKLVDRDYTLQERYAKLGHRNLAAQLRPYLEDPDRRFLAKDAAIDITLACNIVSLQSCLADISLDQDNNIDLRINAARVLARIGDEETKQRLKPLAFSQAGPDPKGELQGHALKALWPGSITASELFALLSSDYQEGHYGALESFISSDIARALSPSDMPVALQWVERQGRRHDMSLSFKRLMDDIMIKAWDLADQPEVQEGFAKACLSRLKNHEDIVGNRSSVFDNLFDTKVYPEFKELVDRQDQKRQAVLATIIGLLAATGMPPHTLIPHRNPFVKSSDLQWMVDQYGAAKSIQGKNIWAWLLGRALDWREQDQIGIALAACEAFPELKQELHRLLGPVELDSEEARQLKQYYMEEKALSQEESAPLLDPPPTTRILEYLDAFEAGDLDAWWRLCKFLPLEPNARMWEEPERSDVMLMPGWISASEQTKERLIEAAKLYIVNFNLDRERWLNEKNYEDIYAGYKALRLLLSQSSDWLETIACDIWKKWLPVILEYPLSTDKDKEANRELIARAHLLCPKEVIETLLFMLDKELYSLDRIGHCEDHAINDALLAKLQDESLSVQVFRYILAHLLASGNQEGRLIAESLVTELDSQNQKAKAEAAAVLLALNTHDAAWKVIWPTIERDTGFGQTVITRIIDRERNDRTMVDKLSEAQLAALYIWLVRQYPHKPSDYRTGYMTGSFTTPAWFRDRVLNRLVERGTPAACAGIEKSMRELPHLEPVMNFVL